MNAATSTLDGDWQINGLPAGYVIIVFMMAQIDSYVTGTLDISNDSTQSFGIQGNNNYPNVVLDFQSGSQRAFTFQGKFADDNTVTGTLSGQFTGPATLTRSDG